MEFIAVAGLYSGVRSEPQKITPYQGLEPVYLRRFFTAVVPDATCGFGLLVPQLQVSRVET